MRKKLPSFSVGKYEEIFKNPIFIDQHGEWYKQAGYQDTLDLIRENIQKTAASVISIGYYLKHLNKNSLFKEGGYETIWECAKEEFGITRGTASRYMEMNDFYSVNGDSPLLDEKYKEFNKGQLQEMLYLPVETREKVIESVSPAETVISVRNIVAEEKAKQEPSSEEICSFYEYTELSKQPRSGWKEYLQSQYGKNDIGLWSDKLKFTCSRRGISFNKHDEITWHQCVQLLNKYIPASNREEIDGESNKCATSHISDNEQLPGQMGIGDYPEVLPEQSDNDYASISDCPFGYKGTDDCGALDPDVCLECMEDASDDVMDYVCGHLCKHNISDKKPEDMCQYCKLSALLDLRPSKATKAV